MDDTCPYARFGCAPQDPTCRLLELYDRKVSRVSYLRQRSMAAAGKYRCAYHGKLPTGVTGAPIPCERFDLCRLILKEPANRCPFATRPDLTGCDCDCGLPRPKGFWARLLYAMRGLARCTSGPGGCGDGSLPCGRLDGHMRSMT